MAKNPYYIDEPCVISFSGGRTSAYMLIQILEAHGGTLPPGHHVVFANTGKEMPETLDFVHRCERELSVPIAWIELASMWDYSDDSTERSKWLRKYRVTDYQGASRKGEPYNVLLDAVEAIPNAVMRSCTSALKVRPMMSYIKDVGVELPVTTFVGIRADEQRRAVKIHNICADGQDRICPLWVSGVTAKDVGDFWASMPWDLELPNNNGVTDWGNCDLCFLKGKSKRASIIRERPDLADWWIKAEERKGQQFRPDEIGYRRMKELATEQPDLFADVFDESIPCFCGD